MTTKRPRVTRRRLETIVYLCSIAEANIKASKATRSAVEWAHGLLAWHEEQEASRAVTTEKEESA